MFNHALIFFRITTVTSAKNHTLYAQWTALTPVTKTYTTSLSYWPSEALAGSYYNEQYVYASNFGLSNITKVVSVSCSSPYYKSYMLKNIPSVDSPLTVLDITAVGSTGSISYQLTITVEGY